MNDCVDSLIASMQTTANAGATTTSITTALTTTHVTDTFIETNASQWASEQDKSESMGPLPARHSAHDGTFWGVWLEELLR